MAHPRRFRFGIQSPHARSVDEWVARARRVEELGYATLLLHDHIGHQLAPLPALAVAAASTSTLRVGTLVLDNDFRHPLVLANEVATVDLLSGGRFEWGMGAGWFPPDYERSGIPFDPPGVRVGRLIEAVSLMKQTLTGDPVDAEGAHYQVKGHKGTPSVQRPHPPLLVGGQGRRMLSFAAREADIVGIAPSLTTQSLFGQPPPHTPEQAVDEQVAWLREAAGDRFDDLELNVVALPATVVDDREAALKQLAENTNRDPAAVAGSPHVILGSVDEICDQLEARRERWGISYYVVPPNALENFAPVVERLAGR